MAAGWTPVAMTLGGIVDDLLDHNIPLIYVTCGAIMIVISVRASFNRKYRKFLTTEPPAAAEIENGEVGTGITIPDTRIRPEKLESSEKKIARVALGFD